MSDWRLLLTRPADECAAQAAELAGHGVASASLPLLVIAPREESAVERALMLDLDRFHVVVAISKPAARLALDRLDRYWPQPPLGPRWFAVGAGTAAILADYGLEVCHPAQGEDSESLLALPALAEALAHPDPRVLILKGEGGREALAEGLRARGAQVEALELYRRERPDYPPGALADCVRREGLNGLVVSSGQGLDTLHALAGADWPWLAARPLFVPSARVAGLARERGAQQVIDCRGAGTPALLAALQARPAPPPPEKG